MCDSSQHKVGDCVRRCPRCCKPGEAGHWWTERMRKHSTPCTDEKPCVWRKNPMKGDSLTNLDMFVLALDCHMHVVRRIEAMTFGASAADWRFYIRNPTDFKEILTRGPRLIDECTRRLAVVASAQQKELAIERLAGRAIGKAAKADRSKRSGAGRESAKSEDEARTLRGPWSDHQGPARPNQPDG